MNITDTLESAKELLKGENYTCVITDGEHLYTSRQRGVAPLLALYDSNERVSGLVAADKVVGRAAAFLYVLLGVSAVHANVISATAKEVLERYNVNLSYDILVDYIRNRTNDGFCPMESATMNCSSPEEALAKIRETQAKLRTASHT